MKSDLRNDEPSRSSRIDGTWRAFDRRPGAEGSPVHFDGGPVGAGHACPRIDRPPTDTVRLQPKVDEECLPRPQGE